MLSLCLTNYNRYEMLLESFQHVYDDPRVSEIVISDDCSDWEIFYKIVELSREQPKIKVYRNEKNLGMSLNKRRAIELATNEWCILGDSDNIFKPDYIDAIAEIAAKPAPFGVSKKTIYCPEFAKPQFDYRKFSGYSFSAKEAKELMNDNHFNMLMNTCNYVVHREEYLKVYQHNPSIKASDTIHFNYLWLKAGGSFYVVPGMQYFHRVHSGSGFLADVNYNMQQAEKTKRMIMQL